MKIIFQFIALSTLFLASCGPKISKENQKKLSDLTSNVDSVVTRVMSIDTVEALKMTKAFFQSKQFIQEEMKDTFERKVIYKLDEFINMRKGMNYLAAEYPNIRKEALTVQNQIETLNEDVKNGLLEDERFSKYYHLEKQNFDALKDATDNLMNIYTRMVKESSEKTPYIDSLMTAYKAKADA